MNEFVCSYEGQPLPLELPLELQLELQLELELELELLVFFHKRNARPMQEWIECALSRHALLLRLETTRTQNFIPMLFVLSDMRAAIANF